MHNDQLSAPVPATERHEIIDIVRGFALFGVLVANWVYITQFIAITDEQREGMPTAQLDTLAAFLTGVFIDGKFFTLFSMLFGLGFAVQISRAASRGGNALPTYARRLTLLLVIGVLHGWLLWYGDVLHVYALLGFLLILFAPLRDRAIIGWIVGILVFMVLVPVVAGMAERAGFESWMVFGREVNEAEIFELTRHGSYEDVLRLNWLVHVQDYGEVDIGGNLLFWYIDIFSKFLIGFLLGRNMLLQRAAVHTRLFKRVMPWTLAAGLLGNTYMNLVWVYEWGRVDSAIARDVLRGLFELCVLSLSAGYVCMLVLLHQNSRWGGILQFLSPVGRMALTNYVSQTVMLMILFYGLGFGLVGRVGAFYCVLISIVFFAAQIALSVWWLKRFRFGPLEWAWRSLTYGRPQPMLQSSARI
ncbi:MAG: DUF418 domain-containing protein [Planctomycetota bacterium]|jgi:uncharacterized protein